MKGFLSLKKIASLPDAGESPLSDRFSSELVAEWLPTITSMSKTYEMPGRLDSADIKQELLHHMWKLTQRMDPVSRSEDFIRMCRTELRNKCIDMSRHAKARKRIGRTGRAVQCLCCGSVTRLAADDELICGFCQEGIDVREVETYSRDISIDNYIRLDTADHMHHSFSDDSRACIEDANAVNPLTSMLESDLLSRVRKMLHTAEDVLVYDLLVNPPDAFLSYVEKIGRRRDTRSTPDWVYAGFLKLPERNVYESQIRIKMAVANLCRED